MGRERIAQRNQVPTTEILWKVPRRGRGSARRKLHLVEAAVIEVSIMGAAIVCPEKWEAPVGGRTQVFWAEVSGWVAIRRAVPYPHADGLMLYGVEYVENPSQLGLAFYDRLVAPQANVRPAPIPWTR